MPLSRAQQIESYITKSHRRLQRRVRRTMQNVRTLLIRQRNAPLLDTFALNYGFVAIATRLYGARNVELRKAKSALVRSEEFLLGGLMRNWTVKPVAVRHTNDDGHARSACFVL